MGLSIASPGPMRAPGTAEANFPIESALDELSYQRTDPQPAESATAPAGAFAAVFAEVRVDRDLGVLRAARLVSVIDGGRIINEKTARSQIIAATVMAIGMTMLEETVFDPGTARIANATFADYQTALAPCRPLLDAETWRVAGATPAGRGGV